MNFYSLLSHSLIDLGEIRYRRSPRHAVE